MTLYFANLMIDVELGEISTPVSPLSLFGIPACLHPCHLHSDTNPISIFQQDNWTSIAYFCVLLPTGYV